MSIKFKIAFLFAVIVTLLMVALGFYVYFYSAKERADTFNTRLKNRALSTARVFASASTNPLQVLKQIDNATVASLYNKSITILDDHDLHEYLFSDIVGDSLLLQKDVIENAKKETEYLFNYNGRKAIALSYSGPEKQFIVAVAALDIDGKEYLQQLKNILWIAVILAFVLSFFSGMLFAKTIINPINLIMSEVNLISTHNFSQRIAIKNRTNDELVKLAQTFNKLLDRLQDSFTIQRRFISNASHELSTPLTSISNQLEVALQRSRGVEEYREVLQSVHEDISELHILTRSLLEIAKAGSQGSIDLNEVRIDDVLFKVVSDIKRQNTDYKTIVGFEEFPDDDIAFTVFGNKNLLYIALKNIVENGCKYSDDLQSNITVSVVDNLISIKVQNAGDIIAESDIENIFQPFFRTESAQQKPGFGLGLTLAKRILILHKGRILASSNPETGTEFIIEIPNIFHRVDLFSSSRFEDI